MLTAIDAIAIDGLRHEPDQPLLERRQELAAFALAPFTDMPPPDDVQAVEPHAPLSGEAVEALLDAEGGDEPAGGAGARGRRPARWPDALARRRRRAATAGGRGARGAGCRADRAPGARRRLVLRPGARPRGRRVRRGRAAALPALRRRPSRAATTTRCIAGSGSARGRRSGARCAAWRPRGCCGASRVPTAPTAGGPPRRRRADPTRRRYPVAGSDPATEVQRRMGTATESDPRALRRQHP